MRDVLSIEITPKQREFINASAFEVLYGGAAGGGKSYGQLVDALLYASWYAGSKQLVLRRTFPELDKSLIRMSKGLYPREAAQYNAGQHTWVFRNGSLIDFGYCDNESDVYKYQSAEYDVIRFDELTHFTETMYLYLISRVRGANNFPKQIKSSTNPGGVGHQWVKERFIELGEWGKEHTTDTGKRIFISARLSDNLFLSEADPEYEKRLDNLGDKERKALKYGDWDIFDGQYFSEWDRDIHTCEPFNIPEHWRRYFTMDYGLDMFAAYIIAVDEQKRAYVTNEIYESSLIISEAAKRIKEMCEGKNVHTYLAPPDMWARRQESGKSVAALFLDEGITLTKTSNDRVAGWLAMKEWLKPYDDNGLIRAKLTVFRNCANLIRCIPALQYDNRDPSDVSTEPHEITHAPDAIRGYCVYWSVGADKPANQDDFPFKVSVAECGTLKGGKYVVV